MSQGPSIPVDPGLDARASWGLSFRSRGEVVPDADSFFTEGALPAADAPPRFLGDLPHDLLFRLPTTDGTAA